jgi:hypothetical protein
VEAALQPRLLDVAEIAVKVCTWCDGAIPEDARADSIYCSKSCRQAAHRFRRAAPGASRLASTALTLAYADPPYPGKAWIYRDHPDYAGEVDHRALLERLTTEFPDGWALSTSAEALPMILRFPECPTDVRVAAWHRGERPTKAHLPLNGWEPVLWRGGRQIASDTGATRRVDSLVYHARARRTDRRRVTGAKPATFIWWLFDLMGLSPIDDFHDLFPGSGGVQRAWEILRDGKPMPPTGRSARANPDAFVDEHDASRSAAAQDDASPGPRD